MPVILFACDAYDGIGFGHASRCLTLADALKRITNDESNIRFCMQQDFKGVQQVSQHFDVDEYVESDSYIKLRHSCGRCKGSSNTSTT